MPSDKKLKKIKRLGVFGGTFNPVHAGHLGIAYAAFAHLKLNHLLFVPNGRPPHREAPRTLPAQRLKLLKLALKNKPYFSVCDFELKTTQPSYTIHTLKFIRQFYSFPKPLYFIIGADSFLTLNQWHAFESLFEYAHFVVFQRPNSVLQNLHPALLKELQKRENTMMHAQKKAAGDILFIAQPPQDIASSTIRQNFEQNRSNAGFLNKKVENFILKNKMYS